MIGSDYPFGRFSMAIQIGTVCLTIDRVSADEIGRWLAMQLSQVPSTEMSQVPILRFEEWTI